jgi:hypothetical protein
VLKNCVLAVRTLPLLLLKLKTALLLQTLILGNTVLLTLLQEKLCCCCNGASQPVSHQP